MKILTLLLTVASLFMASPAMAQDADTYNSDFLLKKCEKYISGSDLGKYWNNSLDSFDAGNCLGFIVGAINMHEFFQLFPGKSSVPSYPEFFCKPSSVGTVQVAKIWVKYLKDNPQELHTLPLDTLIVSLGKAFPCNESQPEK